jgi:glycosyltransferase 2 family protein
LRPHSCYVVLMNRFLKRVVPLLLAAILLAYALKDIAFADIVRQFQQANYWFIGLSALLGLLNYGLRGWRWQQPLLAMGYRPTAFRATIGIMSGMVASMIVLGSGELTRCLTLQRTDGVPLSKGIGSVVAERVLDLIMLALLLLLTLVVEFDRVLAFGRGTGLSFPGSVLFIGLGGVLLIGLGAVSVGRWLGLDKHPFWQRIVGFMMGIWQGISSVRQLPRPGLFVALTVGLQLITWLATYVMLLSLTATRSLPPSAALSIMAAASVGGLAVPTQAGVGTYHFVVSRVLALYGLTVAEGVAVATFQHAVGFGISLVLSSLSFLVVPGLVMQFQNSANPSHKS